MFGLQRTPPQSRRLFLRANVLLFAFLFLSISFNKESLRPNYGQGSLLGILLGCYPNFIAAYVISLFPLALSLAQDGRTRRILFYSTAVLVFALMALEEFHPLWGVSKTFDPFDVMASGLGALLAIATFEFLLWRGFATH